MKDYRDMTYLQAVEIERRMTKRDSRDNCHIECANCPLDSSDLHCVHLKLYNPERYLEILAEWNEANPRKTILQDFMEKHPKAEMNPNRLPIVCPSNLGYRDIGHECDPERCADCWNQPVED